MSLKFKNNNISKTNSNFKILTRPILIFRSIGIISHDATYSRRNSFEIQMDIDTNDIQEIYKYINKSGKYMNTDIMSITK